MSKLKFAIIGAGVWGETHAYLYKEHPGVELTAVCDLNIARARELASKFDITNVYDNHQEMLKKADIDAVAIVTPDFAHGKIGVDCANAGKHMLIENPCYYPGRCRGFGGSR